MKIRKAATITFLLLSTSAHAVGVAPLPWNANVGHVRRVERGRHAREEKFVGVFYYMWHGSHGYDSAFNPPVDSAGGPAPKNQEFYKSPFVIPEIMAQPAEARQWGPVHAFHHWGESRWGHYIADDEWVIRRNGQLLADAGVDVIIMDITNGFTYRHNYEAVCRVYTEMRQQGNQTPQLAFMSWNGPLAAEQVYREFYKEGLYKELWFQWLGKPLMLCPQSQATEEMKEFFTIRESWAWTNPDGWFGDGRDKWPWLADTPQGYGWHDAPDKPEQVVVATAQHPNSNKGKSYRGGKQPPPSEQHTEKGLYFSEQWDHALKVDPEFILITQWNEWIAQRFVAEGPMHFAGEVIAKGDTHFVDLYNMEYNRDIEPMKGGYSDNYYYQMVDGIRRFKGITVPVQLGVYTDDRGDVMHRNHPGYGSAGPHVNKSGRNDIVEARVEVLTEVIRISATTADPLSSPSDPNWMTLYIRLLGEHPDWEGFHLIANRVAPVDGRSIIERSRRGWNWEQVGHAAMTISSHMVSIDVPRAIFNLGADELLYFEFKWSDNMQTPDDPTDWMVSGDAAPNSRFAYYFKEAKAD